MSHLDIIVEPNPGEMVLPQDQAWINWFFSSLDDVDFVMTLCVFGAVYFMILGVIAVFVILFMKRQNIALLKQSPDVDGSVHVIPFLLTILGTFLVIGGIGYILYVVFFTHPYFFRYQPYGLVIPYTVLTGSIHILALRFSPKAGKFYRAWNIACLTPCILIFAVSIYFCLFYWLTVRSWEVLPCFAYWM